MRFFISLLVIGFSLSSPLLAKGPPPGTGVGDAKANIMIMLDDSGSMSRTDSAAGLYNYSYDVAVANNGDIFVADYMRDKITRLDSSYTMKGTVGGVYSRPNNDSSGQALFYDLHAVAMDHGDSTDEFFYAGNTSHQTGRNGFGRSHISKVCTGITVTAQCPKLGKLVAVGNPGSSIGGIAVQGNYVFAIGSAETLYKLDKNNLGVIKSRNIRNSINNFNNSRSDVVAAADYVIVTNYSGRGKMCKFKASNLASETFGNGQHCITTTVRPQGMAISGKGTASTSDDFIYLWQNHRRETIVKYDANTGNRVGGYIRRGSAPGRTQSSYGIDVGPDGHIYVAERGNSRRRYVSKFDDTPTYVSRGPAGGVSQNRMQIAHAAIRAILQDPDLTAGANFGIMSWGSRFNIRTNISTAGANDILTRTLNQIQPNGGTQLGRALQHVRQNYWHRLNRTPIDISAPCQGNFNLIISDGQYWGWPTPEAQMPILTNHQTMPVRSFIVGLGNSISGNNSFINLAGSSYGDTTPPGALFANNVQALTLQLRSAILSAINGNLTFTSPKVDFSSSPNGYICQPSFKYKQEDQWQGILNRFEIKQDGSIDDPLGLNPSKTIRFHELLNGRSSIATDVNGRKIWTIDKDIINPTTGIYQNNNFDPDFITPSGLNIVEESIEHLMLEGETHLGTRDVVRIMKFLRGQDMFDQDSDCTASDSAISLTDSCFTEEKGGLGAPLLYKLHDLYNSTPAYVGAPNAPASPDVAGTESEYRYLNNYNGFKALHQNRKNIILIGSNGGMLHAFDNGCNAVNPSCANASFPGRELWAFVPPAILPNLQHIVSPQTYTKLSADISSTDTSIAVVNTSTFPSSGILRINNEFIRYTGKTSTQFTGLTRGYDCSGNSPFCSDATAQANDTVVYNESTVRKPKYSVYTVDGPIVAKDIYTNGSWKTIVIASFGKGGRGFTVLDVTLPEYPIHMFTILNDIRGPGMGRSIKVWNTTLDATTNTHQTTMNQYDYSLGITSTYLASDLSSNETGSMIISDPTGFSAAGAVTVMSPAGKEEHIFYESIGGSGGRELLTLVRGLDVNGNPPTEDFPAASVVSQDASCTIATSNVPAEYDYTRLALTTSMPHIINIKIAGNKKWVAVFGGGQNYGKDCSTGNVVYVMDLEDNPGQLIREIHIPDADTVNSIHNSVNATLAVVQRDGTSKADYYGALVYVADLENKLWKIDLTDNVPTASLGRKFKLFEDVATDINGRRNYQEILPVVDASQNVPVAGPSSPPAIPDSNILRLYYGTGDMDNLAERSNDILNRLYGISDLTFTNFNNLAWQTHDDTIDRPPLFNITSCDNLTSLAAGCPILSIENNNQSIGWYINLPDSRKTTGRKVLYDKEQVYYVIYQPTNRLCHPGDAIFGTYGYMCPNDKRLVIALGAGLGTGATTQGSQIYVGVSNAGAQGQFQRGDILEQSGSGFGVGGSASAIAQEVQSNTKGTDSIIVLSPSGTTSSTDSSIDAWRQYSGDNYFDN